MPRILLVKTTSMGDIIHNMPVVTDILNRFPDAQIDWVVEESFADIARLHPGVYSIIPVAMRRWKKNLFNRKTWQEFSAFRHRLKTETYDAVLDTQGLLKSAVICRLARGIRHGQDKNTAREGIAASLYHHAHNIPQRLHAVVRNRLLAAQALGYELPLSMPEYRFQAPDEALPLDLPANYVVCVHGTSREEKLWPVASWVALGRHLTSQQLPMLLPWSDASEHERALSIASQVPGAIVLPKMRLTQLATLLKGAHGVIGLDTGLMHMAVALSVPTLGIYTDTELWRVGPFPSAKAKANAIGGKPGLPTVDEAIRAFTQLLEA